MVEIKKQLLLKIKEYLKEQLLLYKKEMDRAQAEANYHKGAMESRYDTFKEEAQMLKDALQGQYNDTKNTLNSIANYEKNIDLNKKGEIVRIGSIVEIKRDEKVEYYFIFPKVLYQEIEIENKRYICINNETPFAKAILNKESGEVLEFNGMSIEIIEVA
jgi:transcription elongation GreA/GreB family factor